MSNLTPFSRRQYINDFEEYMAACAYSNKDLNFANQNQPYPTLWNLSAIPQQVNIQKRLSPVVSTMVWDNIEIQISSNPSSFTQQDLLESEENQISNLIERVRLLQISCREKIANRLWELLNDAKEEDEFSVGITIASLRNFYNFLCLYKNLKCPLIALTPQNEIYASWREGTDKVFSVQFVTSGEIRFVVFVPNKLRPDHQTRISGNTTAELLIKYVEPLDISNWVME